MTTEDFGGTIAREVGDSTPWWPEPVLPDEGSPNVVVILLDDTGFSPPRLRSARSIETPELRSPGPAPACATATSTPPRCAHRLSSLPVDRAQPPLGRHAGRVQLRHRLPQHAGPDRPVSGHRRRGAASRRVGYPRSVSASGTWPRCGRHRPPDPFGDWPVQRGFDRFYGFMQGETDHFHPELYADNHLIDPPGHQRPEDGYHLSEDLVDQAITMIRNQTSLVPGAAVLPLPGLRGHPCPHQAPDEYLAKYRGRFDEGWDVWRQRVHQRQLELGVIPEGTELAPRNPGVRAVGRARRRRAGLRLSTPGGLRRLPRPHRRPGRSAARRLDGFGLTEDTLVIATQRQRRLPGGQRDRRARRVPLLQRHPRGHRGRRSPTGSTTSAPAAASPTTPGAGPRSATPRPSATSRTRTAAVFGIP